MASAFARAFFLLIITTYILIPCIVEAVEFEDETDRDNRFSSGFDARESIEAGGTRETADTGKIWGRFLFGDGGKKERLDSCEYSWACGPIQYQDDED